MRKVILSLAAAGAALAVASPAAAQFYPQPQPYGYVNGYNNYGQVRALQARVDALEWQIRQLDRRNVVRDRDADRLRDQARRIESRLRQAGRFGLNPAEANDIQMRLARLEQSVRYASANRYGRYDRNNGRYYGDRDRDHDRDWRDNDRRDHHRDRDDD